MGRAWPVDSIPDSSVVADGVYLLSIAGIEEKQNRKGGLMYAGEFRVVEPTAFAGSPIYENFSIGTEDDPDAEDPETWKASVGARILKRVFKAAGVEQAEDIDDMIAAAVDQRVIAIIARVVDDGKNDPQYKGRERNRVTGWYAPGEREVKVDGVSSKARGPIKGSVAAPAAKPVGRSKAAPPPEPEEDEDEPAPPPPRAAKKAAPAATEPAKAPVTKPKTVKCDICNEEIPSREFSAHVAKHEEDEE